MVRTNSRNILFSDCFGPSIEHFSNRAFISGEGLIRFGGHDFLGAAGTAFQDGRTARDFVRPW
jgi:hypothetical protein